MIWRMAKAVLILPGTALVYVPLLLQWVTGGWPFGAAVGAGWQIIVAAVMAVPALGLALWTMRLFVEEGEGTPAPWDPPVRFVVSGPYRYVRNPMLSAVIVLILAESAALSSVVLFGWAVVFFVLNTVYFIRSEEPALEARFGEDYRVYKAAVPRWVPRVRRYEAGR